MPTTWTGLVTLATAATTLGSRTVPWAAVALPVAPDLPIRAGRPLSVDLHQATQTRMICPVTRLERTVVQYSL